MADTSGTMIPSSQPMNTNVVVGATTTSAEEAAAAAAAADGDEKYMFWKMAKKICSQKRKERRSAAIKAYQRCLEPTIVPTEILWPSSGSGGGGDGASNSTSTGGAGGSGTAASGSAGTHACSSVGLEGTGTGTEGGEKLFDLGNLLLPPPTTTKATTTTTTTTETNLRQTTGGAGDCLSDMEDGSGRDHVNDDADSCVSDVTRELPDIDAPTLYPSLDFLDVELPDLSVKEQGPGKLEVTSTVPATNLHMKEDESETLYPIHCIAEEPPLAVGVIFGDNNKNKNNNNNENNRPTSMDVLSNACKPAKRNLELDSTGSLTSSRSGSKCKAQKEQDMKIDMEEIDNLLAQHMNNLTMNKSETCELQNNKKPTTKGATTTRASSSSPTPQQQQQQRPPRHQRGSNRAQSSSPVPPRRRESRPSNVLPKLEPGDYRRTVTAPTNRLNCWASPIAPTTKAVNNDSPHFRRTLSESSPIAPQRRESRTPDELPMPNYNWNTPESSQILRKVKASQVANDLLKPQFRRAVSESSPIAPQRRKSRTPDELPGPNYGWKISEPTATLPKVRESHVSITEVLPMPENKRSSSESSPTLPARRPSQATNTAVLPVSGNNRAISTATAPILPTRRESEESSILSMPGYNRAIITATAPILPTRRESEESSILPMPGYNRAISSATSPTLPTRRESEESNVLPMPEFNRAISSATSPSLPKRRLSLDSQRGDNALRCSVDSDGLRLKQQQDDDEGKSFNGAFQNGSSAAIHSGKRTSLLSAPMPPQRRLSLDSRMSEVDDQTYIPTREELGYEDISVCGRPQIRQSDNKRKSNQTGRAQTTMQQDGHLPIRHPQETASYSTRHDVNNIIDGSSNACYGTPNQSLKSSGHKSSKPRTPRSRRWEPEALSPTQEGYGYEEMDDHFGDLPNARLPYRRNSFASLLSNDSTIATWTLGLYQRRKSADSTVAEPMVPGWAIPDSTPSQPRRRLSASSLLREQLAATESRWNCAGSIDDSKANLNSMTNLTVSSLGLSSGLANSTFAGLSSPVSGKGVQGKRHQNPVGQGQSLHMHKSLCDTANCDAPYKQQQSDEEENRSTKVEIQPGLFLPLRGIKETTEAAQRNFLERTSCMACGIKLMCISDAHYVLCPLCREVSPVLANLGSCIGGGVGLGMEVNDPSLAFTKFSPKAEVCAARPA